MKKTNVYTNENMLAVNMDKLQAMLGVGRNTANKVGKDAGAIIHIGRRKLFNVKKVQDYLDQKTEEESRQYG